MTRNRPPRLSARFNMVKAVVHAVNPRIPDILAIEPAEAARLLSTMTVAEVRQSVQPPKEQPAMDTKTNQGHAPAASKTPIRKISQKDFFRLCEWLRKNVTEGQEVTQVALARQASNDLGLEVAASSIATALEATEITIRSPAGKAGSTPYKQSLGVLANAILLIVAKEGIAMPAELVEQLKELTK